MPPLTPEQIKAEVEQVRAYFAGLADSPPEPSSPPYKPCRWEGVILEMCVDGCGRDWRHVRACDCEASEATRCTRGANSGKDVDIASCTRGPDGNRCPHFELPASASEESAARKLDGGGGIL